MVYLDLPGMRFFFALFALLLKGRNFCLIFSESFFVFKIACREIMKPKLPEPNYSTRHLLIHPNYLNTFPYMFWFAQTIPSHFLVSV
jgi:hypothetical protein